MIINSIHYVIKTVNNNELNIQGIITSNDDNSFMQNAYHDNGSFPDTPKYIIAEPSKNPYDFVLNVFYAHIVSKVIDYLFINFISIEFENKCKKIASKTINKVTLSIIIMCLVSKYIYSIRNNKRHSLIYIKNTLLSTFIEEK